MWPFRRKKKVKQDSKSIQGYDELACEFFRMCRHQQVLFLSELTCSTYNYVDRVLLDRIELPPHIDVMMDALPDGRAGLLALEFKQHLIQLLAEGRKHTVVAVLQNIFPAKAAKEYAERLEE